MMSHRATGLFQSVALFKDYLFVLLSKVASTVESGLKCSRPT